MHAIEQFQRGRRGVLPFTASVISEAEAVEMAQPWPSKRMSLMVSSRSFRRSVR